MNTSIKPEVRLYPAVVPKEQIFSILVAWGMSETEANVTADVMVETDLRGVDSHGINMLRQYEETKQRGALNISPNTEIVRERKTTALLDADRGLGHPVSVKAMEMAIERAKIFDIGTVCVRNSHHFGAAGYYAELAAAKGMIGVVTTSTRGISMVPTHGTQPVLGTNPFSFSTRAGKYPPLVLDFATTVAAVNKVNSDTAIKQKVFRTQFNLKQDSITISGEGTKIQRTSKVDIRLDISTGGIRAPRTSSQISLKYEAPQFAQAVGLQFNRFANIFEPLGIANYTQDEADFNSAIYSVYPDILGKRFNDLFLAGDTIDLAGATISSDGTGSISIAATGATLPAGSKAGENQLAVVSSSGEVGIGKNPVGGMALNL